MNESVLYILIGCTPSMLGLLGYMVRIERALTKTKTDLCWIKKELEKRE
jgi:hypothetical protein